MDRPIIFKNVLDSELFFSVHETMHNHLIWDINNLSYNNGSASWGLERDKRNTELIFFKVASIIKLKCVQKHIKKKLQLTSIMYNGQTSGQKSEFHRDSPTLGPHDDSVWTFVLFTEKFWNTQWGGELVVQYPIKDEFDYFYAPYIPNNGVLLKSGWDHFGSSPNHCTDNVRTTVGYTFTETNVIDERLKMPFGDEVMKYFL